MCSNASVTDSFVKKCYVQYDTGHVLYMNSMALFLSLTMAFHYSNKS